MRQCIAIIMQACIIGRMKPSDAIAHLKRAGLTEKAIGAEVGANQSTINRIANGTEPSYALGAALVDLANATVIPANDDREAA